MTCLPEQRLEGHVCGVGGSMAERVTFQHWKLHLQHLGEAPSAGLAFSVQRFSVSARAAAVGSSVFTCVEVVSLYAAMQAASMVEMKMKM